MIYDLPKATEIAESYLSKFGNLIDEVNGKLLHVGYVMVIDTLPNGKLDIGIRRLVPIN